jgi:glutathione S-transferase
MLARPGVEKGRHVPTPHKISQTEKEAAETKKWVQGGMKEDAKP